MLVEMAYGRLAEVEGSLRGQRQKRRSVAFIALLSIAVTPAAFAGTNDLTGGTRTAPLVLDHATPIATTRHVGVFNGRKSSYTATVEKVPLPGRDGRPGALAYTFSYVADHGPAERPVLFAFNGGPGSSSIWLHMGLLGPRIFAASPKPGKTAAPFALIDNPDSVLDACDIVLIDPPGTGLGRLLPGAAAPDFYSAERDAVATGTIIKQWLTQHRRWNAPKYLLGESYGTIRAVLVADLLGGDSATGKMDGVTFNGVMLMGQDLDNGGLTGDRAVANFLTAEVATAWYHHRGATEARSVQDAVRQAEAFLEREYVPFLYRGDRAGPAETAAVADKLQALTGLGLASLHRQDFRIEKNAFARELLASTDRDVGIYDSRFTLKHRPEASDVLADDPSMGQYTPGYIATFNQYLSSELGIETSDEYIAIDLSDINAKWAWDSKDSKDNFRPNFSNRLASVMRRTPTMRLLVMAGYYDLVTPAGEAAYVLHHSGLPDDRTEMKMYESGHMAYLGGTIGEVSNDIRKFVIQK